MKIMLVALHFSPGHMNHILAYYHALTQKKSNDLILVLDREYTLFEKELEGKRVFYDYSKEKCDIAIFFCPSWNNFIFASNIKKNGGKIVYLYHEPWRGYKNYIIQINKIWAPFKVICIHVFSSLMLKESDCVIVPSRFSFIMFQKNENPKIVKNTQLVKLNLLYNDYYNEKFEIHKEKKYFSYIGHICYQHAFDRYVEFVQKYYLKVPWKFMIASRNSLDKETFIKLKPVIDSGKLILHCGKAMTNDEINEYYGTSFLIWNLYRTSNQSGVLPNAYMHGTPVLASNVGSFNEYVIDGKTGWKVEDTLQSIKQAATEIYNHKKEYVRNSRLFFIQKLTKFLIIFS